MKNLIFVLLAFAMSQTVAQIIPNPGFEFLNSCPQYNNDWEVQSWIDPSLCSHPNSHPTSDNFHACGTTNANLSGTPFGPVTAHSGSGIIGLCLYHTAAINYREYAAVQLDCDLIAGVQYTVSFWVRKPDTCLNHGGDLIIDKIGVLFSNGAITQPCSFTTGHRYTQIPQIETTTYISGVAWQQLSFQYTPNSNFNYMTVGCFRSDSVIVAKTPNCTKNSYAAYYFFDDFQIITNTQPNITSSTGANVCQGQCTNLQINGATSFIWSANAGNSTNQSVNVCPSQLGTTTYAVSGINPMCGSFNISININVLPIINLTTQNTGYCTGNANGVNISANSTYVGPVTYQWSGVPGNGLGQTHFVSPTTTQIYYVTASAPGQCPNTAAVTVNVTNQCCLTATVGFIPITNLNNLVPNNSYRLLNSVSVGGGGVLSLKDVEIQMWPGIDITVQPGTTLDLDHAHLYACGLEMWQGIVISDGAMLTTLNAIKPTSLIEDAMIAVDVVNSTAPNIGGGATPININNVVFNKNRIGIRITGANGNTIPTYPIGLTECVFTSRHLPFIPGSPASGSWPDASTTGLRNAINPTSGLLVPYLVNYPSKKLLKPYTNTESYIAIQAMNIDDQNILSPTTGLDIGFTYPNTGTDFNVIDNHLFGIDITNASLAVMNCVFQNIHHINGHGGLAIMHKINNNMNARLNLTPGTASLSDGNKFWENLVCVQAGNVYQADIQYNTFRSEPNPSHSFGPGIFGIMRLTNRFDDNINHNEFNNIAKPIYFDVRNGTYDINGLSGSGTYANNLFIKQNYMGPEVSSSNQSLNTYLDQGIEINGAKAANWLMAGKAEIFSNKIDRAYRGMYINRMEDYPIEVGGNLILVEDDFNAGNDQYGIYAHAGTGNLIINQNDVSAVNAGNPLVKLIRCRDNIGMGGSSPVVTANWVSNGYIGFAFEGNQRNTHWWCNRMTVPMTYGFSLEDSPVTGPGNIGQQGSSTLESGNRYLGTWMPGSNWYTRTVNSPASNSPLYIVTAIAPVPTHFGMGSAPYANNSTFFNSPQGNTNDCMGSTTYPSTPVNRIMYTAIDEEENTTMSVYPNPTSGDITITSAASEETLLIRIMDLQGKVLMEKRIEHPEEATSLQLKLEPSVYLITITGKNGTNLHKKLIVKD